MNKDQLVDAVAEPLGDRRTAAVAVDAVLAAVQRAVAAGEKVSLFGFGVFEKADRAARSARNPATGAPVSVAATSVPRFRAGQSFKDVVSGAKPAPSLPTVTGAPLAVAPRRAAVRTESVAPVEVTEAGREAAAQAVSAPAEAAAPAGLRLRLRRRLPGLPGLARLLRRGRRPSRLLRRRLPRRRRPRRRPAARHR